MWFKFIKYSLILLMIILVVIAILFIRMEVKLRKGAKEAEAIYESYIPKKITDFGTVQNLSITPLVDWHAVNTNLKTEMGVAYLIEADELTILFDLGFNGNNEAVSPLAHNMQQLDISLDNINIIYISHNHPDHVGAWSFVENNTFGINLSQEEDLSDKQIYTPIEMTYPGANPTATPEPTVIAPGIASIGTIPRQLFLGRIDEQALAINVAGKGLVLVVGCAHQRIPKIIERTQAVFDEKIYGIIGGLHLPVPSGRWIVAGIDLQRVHSGDGPLNPISQEDVDRYLTLFKSLNLGVLSIGGHDSSDEVMKQAKTMFGPAYKELKVGLKMEI